MCLDPTTSTDTLSLPLMAGDDGNNSVTTVSQSSSYCVLHCFSLCTVLLKMGQNDVKWRNHLSKMLKLTNLNQRNTTIKLCDPYHQFSVYPIKRCNKNAAMKVTIAAASYGNNNSNNNVATKTQQSTLEFGKEPDISPQTLQLICFKVCKAI
jgi:hypothetical protein